MNCNFGITDTRRETLKEKGGGRGGETKAGSTGENGFAGAMCIPVFAHHID